MIQFRDILQPKQFEIDFHIRHTCGHNTPEQKFVYEEFIDQPNNMNLYFANDFLDDTDNNDLHIDGIEIANWLQKQIDYNLEQPIEE